MLKEGISRHEDDRLKGYSDFPVVSSTRDSIYSLLKTTPNNDRDLIFLLDDEKVGIIEYSLDMNYKTCYIGFFGTQNGEANFIENKKLLQLDAISQGKNSKKHLSYAMMKYFVENICLPNNIDKIYLHPDDQEKTIFWKYKIGAYFKSTGVFSQVTGRDVIWFTLSAKK